MFMLQSIRRFMNATRKYVFKDTRYFFWYLWRVWQPGYRCDVSFYSPQELLEKIRHGSSLVRIGDGEIHLIHFGAIHYQKWSPEIRDAFIELLRSYRDDSPYLIGLPVFANQTNHELSLANTKSVWLPLKITVDMLCDKNVRYMDSHLFYRDAMFAQYVFPAIKDKYVVVVSAQENIVRFQESDVLPHAHFITIPSRDSFEDRESILNSIRTAVDESGRPRTECIVLFAAGLVKTIIPQLASEGYQSLDIGRGLEAFFDKNSIESYI